jgi:hypothetical protein
MLMFGLQHSGAMCFRPDQVDSSTAPASHSARASSEITWPIENVNSSSHAEPEFTVFMKLVGQYTVQSTLAAQDDWTP